MGGSLAVRQSLDKAGVLALNQRCETLITCETGGYDVSWRKSQKLYNSVLTKVRSESIQLHVPDYERLVPHSGFYVLFYVCQLNC